MRIASGDLIGGVVLGLLGVAIVAGAFALRVGTPTHPQPGFFPFLGGAALAGLSLLLVLQALRGASAGGEAFGEVRRPAIMVAGLVVYTLILERVGYVLATVLIGALILRVLGVGSWVRLAVGAVVLAVVTYVLFERILGIDLPGGLLESLG